MLYLITHVTSIGAAVLYTPVQDNPGYILGAGSDFPILLGVFLEVILALTVIGTSVALYPAVKRQNEAVALGYIGLRTLEAGIIAVGVIPLLALVTLRELVGTAGSDPATLVSIGHTLVAFHNWTFLLGPGLVCGTNTVLMAYLMYRSRLVPRFIPVLGLVGGPLIFAVNAAQLFGVYDRLPAWAGIVVIPIFAWELTLAIWLIIKGFRSSATTNESAAKTANELLVAA